MFLFLFCFVLFCFVFFFFFFCSFQLFHSFFLFFSFFLGGFFKDWSLQKFFRVSSRDFARQTGRDQVQRDVVDAKSKGGDSGCYRNVWERFERASSSVLESVPNVRDWNAEEPVARQVQGVAASAKSRIWAKERKYLLTVIASIKETFKELSGKRGVIILGSSGGSGVGVKGTRGHYCSAVEKVLAEFFLVLKIDEHNTTKLCPRCHQESHFAKRSEIRSKCCDNLACGWKDKDGSQHKFCYDRDFGAVRKRDLIRFDLKKKKCAGCEHVFYCAIHGSDTWKETFCVQTGKEVRHTGGKNRLR